jgi:hypothetical protein
MATSIATTSPVMASTTATTSGPTTSSPISSSPSSGPTGYPTTSSPISSSPSSGPTGYPTTSSPTSKQVRYTSKGVKYEEGGEHGWSFNSFASLSLLSHPLYDNLFPPFTANAQLLSNK